MTFRRLKSTVVAVFSICILFFANGSFAQEKQVAKEDPKEETSKGAFDANEVIFGHIMDAHEFHFLSYKGSDGKDHHVTISLPVILYSQDQGWSVFMSSAFHHGEELVNGYRLLDRDFMKEHHLELVKDASGQPIFHAEKVYRVTADGMPDPNVKVYDISLTRNVVQMVIALVVLIWILLAAAKKYGQAGAQRAPSGMQNAMEVVITFIRDEVAKPNLGTKSDKYLPFLLTIFFFILINNIFGLVPGSANVTGNIAFTMVLALLSFIVIMFSTNKHYWGHIVNPPVPGFVKPIMFPVEVLGIFIKPFALMIRLFANMMAGHIIIICLVSLIFIFGNMSKAVGWGFSPVSVAFAVFVYFIEILVAFIQAFIFTNLTAVFISQAREGSHDDPEHEHDDPVMI